MVKQYKYNPKSIRTSTEVESVGNHEKGKVLKSSWITNPKGILWIRYNCHKRLRVSRMRRFGFVVTCVTLSRVV